MKEGPESEPHPNGKLSFEEFVAPETVGGKETASPRYLNFSAFVDKKDYGMMREIARQQPYYQDFQSQYPELFNELTERISEERSPAGSGEYGKLPENLERKLFDAYNHLRNLGATDKNLNL